MPWTVTEFVSLLRAKAPEAYKNLSDTDLAGRMLAKYPKYEEQIKWSSPKERFQLLSQGHHAMNLAEGGLEGSKADLASYEIPQGISGGMRQAAGAVRDLAEVGNSMAEEATVQPIKRLAENAQHLPGQLEELGRQTIVKPIEATGQMVSDVAHGDFDSAREDARKMNPGYNLFVEPTVRHAQQALAEAKAGESGEALKEGLRAVPIVGESVANAVETGHPGDMLGDFLTAEAMGGVGRLGGKALSKAAPKLLGKVSQPIAEFFHVGADPMSEVTAVRARIGSADYSSMVPQLEQRIAQYDGAAQQMFSGSAGAGKTVDLVKAINDGAAEAIQTAKASGASAEAITELDAARRAQLADLHKQAGIKTGAASSLRASLPEAQRFKTMLGDSLSYGQDTALAAKSNLAQHVYKAIDQELTAAAPQASLVLERQANAVGAKGIIGAGGVVGKRVSAPVGVLAHGAGPMGIIGKMDPVKRMSGPAGRSMAAGRAASIANTLKSLGFGVEPVGAYGTVEQQNPDLASLND